MIGDQPRDVLCGAADEILQVVKNDKMKEKEKRKECELLIGSLPEDRYAVLANLSRKITDFVIDERSTQPQTDENLDETYGVNVQFEESDEDNDDDDFVGEVREDDEEDEFEGEEAAIDSAIHASNLETTKVETRRDRRGKTSAVAIHPREIDAYWLQRKLSKSYDDPVVAQSKAAEVLKILKVARDDHEVENQLVVLLGFDQFDFIKVLRQNRSMILYCTLLASAQKQSEKNKLRDKMKSDPELAKILRALETTDHSDSSERTRKDVGKSHLKEDDDNDDENVTQVVKGKVLDLEDLAFTQGSHFMANKRCQLPDGSFRKQRKGCEVIHVPALKPKPFDANEVFIHFVRYSRQYSRELSPLLPRFL
jgi:pre-mRNA-splicing helicase BRR2